MSLLLFIVAGLMAVAGAVGVVLAKQPVHQVLATVFNFMGLAALYLSLSGEFMAVIQIIVYGGAVMILFLFVIALLSARKDPVEKDAGQIKPVAGYAVGGAVLAILAVVSLVGGAGKQAVASLPADFGTVSDFGMELLTVHVLPFELTAFVLMVAVIGVVILVGRQQQQ